MKADSKWIWAAADVQNDQYAEFTDSFLWLDGSAELLISADSNYAVWVNGVYAASGQYPDYPHYKVYDELDITEFLTEGKNRICILAWYFGKSGMRYNTPTPGIIFEALLDGEVVFSSGTDTLSRKSRTYRSGDIKKISPQLGYSFTYDATSEKDTAGFSESVIIAEKSKFFKEKVCIFLYLMVYCNG